MGYVDILSLAQTQVLYHYITYPQGLFMPFCVGIIYRHGLYKCVEWAKTKEIVIHIKTMLTQRYILHT